VRKGVFSPVVRQASSHTNSTLRHGTGERATLPHLDMEMEVTGINRSCICNRDLLLIGRDLLEQGVNRTCISNRDLLLIGPDVLEPGAPGLGTSRPLVRGGARPGGRAGLLASGRSPRAEIAAIVGARGGAKGTSAATSSEQGGSSGRNADSSDEIDPTKGR